MKNRTWLLGVAALASLLLAAALPAQTATVALKMTTSKGIIELEVYLERAPVTAANFLRYVDAGLYDGGEFYRVVRMDNQPQSRVKIEVIQGGLGVSTYDEAEPRRGFPPIAHETTQTTGLQHEDGTVSMARLAPGTASSEFFVCIGDQPSLDYGGARNPDGQGFAAFGRVTAGMDVVRAIQAGSSAAEVPEGRSAIAGQLLDASVRILSVERP